MKTTPYLQFSLIAAFAVTSLRAAPAPPTAEQWAAALSAREKRADLIHGELKALDSRIEGRIDVIIKALSAVGDSKDSKTKVARMKEQTIDALTKNIDYFRTKRATLLEELRRPTMRLTEEQKRTGVAAFDGRIDKRVEQILTVQKSLPTHRDYEKYKATGSDWHGTTYENNQDHEQNRRVTAYTNSQRKEIVQGLRDGIARLEEQGRMLKAKNAPAEDLERIESILAERRKQLAEALASGGTATEGIGKEEAHDLDKALQTALGELRSDFTTLFANYSTYLQEFSSVNQARAAIDAAKPKHRNMLEPHSHLIQDATA